jgi:hypothetical protein
MAKRSPSLYPDASWITPVKQLPVDGLRLPDGWSVVQTLNAETFEKRMRYARTRNHLGQAPGPPFRGAFAPIVLRPPGDKWVILWCPYDGEAWSNERTGVWLAGEITGQASIRAKYLKVVDKSVDYPRMCMALNACQAYFDIRHPQWEPKRSLFALALSLCLTTVPC